MAFTLALWVYGPKREMKDPLLKTVKWPAKPSVGEYFEFYAIENPLQVKKVTHSISERGSIPMISVYFNVSSRTRRLLLNKGIGWKVF